VATQLVSVVPTFNPGAEALDLVQTLATSAPVVVSDDASACTADPVLAAMGAMEGVRVIRNDRNQGIGRGLNQGLLFAREIGAPWLLTVDQDSMVDSHYAPAMVEYANQLIASGVRLAALGAGDVRDASGPLVYPTRSIPHGREQVVVTEEVVQSGTLWSVDALTQIGGFDESLGMDAVDAAACLGLRARGFLVAVDPQRTLKHRIDGAQQVSILGKQVMVTGHSSARRQAIVRNRLRLFPGEFRQSPVHAVRTVRRGLVNYLAVPLRKRT